MRDGLVGDRRLHAAGTVIASFTVEKFSLDRLTELTKEQVAQRYNEFAEMVAIREPIVSG